MECVKCSGEMFEVSKLGSKATMRCDDCGKQEAIFIKKEIAKPISVPMWKSKCMSCKKLFVGNKKYCSYKCYFLKNPKPFKDESLARYGFIRNDEGKIEPINRKNETGK